MADSVLVPVKHDRPTGEWTHRSSRRGTGTPPHPASIGTLRTTVDVSNRPNPSPAPSKLRRREPRYLVVEDKLWMEWWDGEDYVGRAARLVNVSRHGAMIVGTMVLRVSQVIKICLEEPAPQIAVKAVVKGFVQGRSGLHQIRVEFQSPCPDAFIESASNGFENWLAGGRRTN